MFIDLKSLLRAECGLNCMLVYAIADYLYSKQIETRKFVWRASRFQGIDLR